MNRRGGIAAAVALAFVPLALAAGSALAQTAKSVAGTYSAVSVRAFGDNPRGMLILTENGRYAIVVGRTTLPKIAAGARTKGTADENRAVVDGTIAHYGRYTIDDGGKTITLHVEMSTFPNWDGTTQKRPLKVSGDTLSYTVPVPSTGGPPAEVVWKRIK